MFVIRYWNDANFIIWCLSFELRIIFILLLVGGLGCIHKNNTDSKQCWDTWWNLSWTQPKFLKRKKEEGEEKKWKWICVCNLQATSSKQQQYTLVFPLMFVSNEYLVYAAGTCVMVSVSMHSPSIHRSMNCVLEIVEIKDFSQGQIKRLKSMRYSVSKWLVLKFHRNWTFRHQKRKFEN